MRKEYLKTSLRKQDLKADPFEQFVLWFEEAMQQDPESNAMQLATASKDGRPSCRTVLLKKINSRGFVFFTNYESRKGKELEENPFAFATFWWKELERQVCIEGGVQKTSQEESDTYFLTRPKGAQLATWASKQDTPISSRMDLEREYLKYEKIDKKDLLMRPHYWGGFYLIPTYFEFWQGRNNRLHDRLCYNLEDGTWRIQRLSP